MALFITEYSRLASDSGSNPIAAAMEPSVTEQSFTVPGTSAIFNAQTAFVMIHAQEAACLAFGTSPTATTAKQRIAAGETRFVGIPQGAGFRVAAVLGV